LGVFAFLVVHILVKTVVLVEVDMVMEAVEEAVAVGTDKPLKQIF